PRRLRCLLVPAVAAAAFILAAAALAQRGPYPSSPVRIIVGFPPGGGVDVLASVLINSNTMIVNQIVNPAADYDVEKNLVPVINVAWQPNILAAASAMPGRTLADLIAQTRTRKVTYGTPGQGSMPHLGAVFLFGVLAKTDLLHVPYNGAAPALTAVVAGQTDLAFVTMPPAVPFVKAGRLKGIAVTSAKRTLALPEVPTVAESGFPGYEVNV